MEITTRSRTIVDHAVKLGEDERWVQSMRFGVREFTVDHVTVEVTTDEKGDTMVVRCSGVRKLKSGKPTPERLHESYYPGFGIQDLPKEADAVLAALGLERPA